MKVKLHYIFDPMCGWCYAASPLLAALSARFGSKLELVFYPGLLFAEPREIEQPYRQHIITADTRISDLAGVSFGEPYLNRVRTAAILRYHSVPPAAAVMAAQALNPDLGLPMLESIQRSHYQLGEDVCAMPTLKKLAQEMMLDGALFLHGIENIQQSLPSTAIEARKFMQALGGNGFPTMAIERNGEYQLLEHGSAYGKPDALNADIEKLFAMH